MVAPPAVIVVDGTCVFCNRLVSFILSRDPAGLFHFTHVQSDFARRTLARHGVEPNADVLYLIDAPGTSDERILLDGAAGRAIWPRLYRIAVVLRWLPLPILNFGYRLFARMRFRLFGRYDACIVPAGAQRGRFMA
jgi:predicted DCC family thiol-disulfide oxidoreductase YuxK